MIGLTCFACAEDLVLASVGRVLIGCGSAAAFLGVNKIGGDWFPSGRRAFVFGLTMTAGTIGALNGGAPLAALNQAAGWRWSLVYLAVIGAVIFFINLIFLKASPQTITREQNLKMSEIFSQIKSALGNLQVFITGIVALGVYMAISVLADLWGVSYLVQTYHVAKTTALIYVGLCVGALIVSWWSDKIHKRKIFIVILSFMIAFCLTLFLYLESLPFWGSCILLFVIGFCSGAEMLCFALATEIVPRKITGTVTGYINAIVTLGGAFVQQQVGKILDHIWCGQCTDDGLRFYSAAEYKQALSLVIAVVLFTAILSLFLKERKHRSA
jgi:MFS family permease